MPVPIFPLTHLIFHSLYSLSTPRLLPILFQVPFTSIPSTLAWPCMVMLFSTHLGSHASSITSTSLHPYLTSHACHSSPLHTHSSLLHTHLHVYTYHPSSISSCTSPLLIPPPHVPFSNHPSSDPFPLPPHGHLNHYIHFSSYSLYPHMPSAHTHRAYHILHHFIHFPSQTSSSPVTCPLLSPPCYPCLSYFLVILPAHVHAPEIWSLHPRHPIPSL